MIFMIGGYHRIRREDTPRPLRSLHQGRALSLNIPSQYRILR